MDRDEALKIARVLRDVDGGCHVCVASAAADAQKVLPQFDWAELIAEVDEYSTADEIRSNMKAFG